jgi:polyferredoxin
MNGYVLLTTEEKRKLARISPEQKRKDYHYAAKVFVGLSVISFVLFLEFLFLIFNIQASAVFMSIILILTAVLIIYVIVTQIRDGRFKE